MHGIELLNTWRHLGSPCCQSHQVKEHMVCWGCTERNTYTRNGKAMHGAGAYMHLMRVEPTRSSKASGGLEQTHYLL